MPDWREYDLLVVMGDGMSVYEEDVYPWLGDENRAIRSACSASPCSQCLGFEVPVAVGKPFLLKL